MDNLWLSTNLEYPVAALTFSTAPADCYNCSYSIFTTTSEMAACPTHKAT